MKLLVVPSVRTPFALLGRQYKHLRGIPLCGRWRFAWFWGSRCRACSVYDLLFRRKH